MTSQDVHDQGSMRNSDNQGNETANLNINGLGGGVIRGKHKKMPRTYINIQHDPRVVKGNTYAAFVIPSSLQLEFLRLKEEEERRIRVMKQNNKLPRVALLAHKKDKRDFIDADRQKRPDSPIYNVVDEEPFEDDPYYFIDKAPTPKYIPLPPGREIGTQIDDLELFDYELEVEPILEVLIGRTLVLSRYELIEEEERAEFIEQSRLIAQRREFELIKLQREEAARIRRDKEIERRNLQKQQRIERDKLVQKKILSKYYSKQLLRPLQRRCFDFLIEKDFFTNKTSMKITDIISQKFLPQANKFSTRTQINKKIFNDYNSTYFKREISKHGILMEQVFEERKEEKEKKEKEKEEKKIADEIFEKEKAERKEKHRVEKFTRIIEETILKTKYDKVDLSSVPLCDIEDFTQVSSGIHTVGGQFGEFVIAVQGLLESLVYKYGNFMKQESNDNQENIENIEKKEEKEEKENQESKPVEDRKNDIAGDNDEPNDMGDMENPDDPVKKAQELERLKKQKEALFQSPLTIYPSNISDKHKERYFDMEKFVRNIVNLFLQGLKENENFTIKYLESQRFDFNELPQEPEKRKEFKDFLLDERRFHNKSLKILINSGLIEKKLYEIILSQIADVYFYSPVDTGNPDITALLNPEPENQAPEYLEQVKIDTEKLNQQNSLLEKMKKRIKISFVKPEILKKKRENVIGLIRVFPVEDTYETYTEQYVEEILDEDTVIEDINENNDNEGNENKEGEKEGEKKDDNENIDEKEKEENADMENNNNEEKSEDKEKNDKDGEFASLNQEKSKENIKNVSGADHKEDSKRKIEEDDGKKLVIFIEKEPRFISYDYINKAQLFRNTSVVGDCYISHHGVTDIYKIAILKNISQEFRRYYKRYKEEIDTKQRIFEEEQEKIRKEQEEKQRILDQELAEKEALEKEKEEKEEKEKEENEEKDKTEKTEKKDDKKTIDSKNAKNNKEAKENKDKDKKVKEKDSKRKDTKDTKDKDLSKDKKQEVSNTSIQKNSKNTSNLNNSDSRNKGGEKGDKDTGRLLDTNDKILEEEGPLDNYSSKSLMDLVKEKYNSCQNYVENQILQNEKFWSKNRKKHYCVIPIEVLPPKIEEENPEEDN